MIDKERLAIFWTVLGAPRFLAKAAMSMLAT